jgi:hypothetical protein
MVESCDAQIFLSLPALVVLHNLKSIIRRFAPTINIDEVISEVKKCSFEPLELDILELEPSGQKVALQVKSAGV